MAAQSPFQLGWGQHKRPGRPAQVCEGSGSSRLDSSPNVETSGPPPTLPEVVSALVTAWRNLAAYPPGHPARASALAAAHGRVRASLAAASPLVLGIGRDGLLGGGKKLESPQVRAFARALYRRNGGLLRIEEDVEPAELERFLAILGDTGPGRDRPLTGDELPSAGITHISISAIDYSALVTTTDVAPAAPEERSLWDGLMEALLAEQPLPPAGDPSGAREHHSAETIASLFRGGPGTGGPGGGGPGGGGPGGGGTGSPGGGGPSGRGWGVGGLGRGSGQRGGGGASPASGPAELGGRLGMAAAYTLAGLVGARLDSADSDEREKLAPQIIQLLRALPQSRFAQAVGIIRAVRELAADPSLAERRELLDEFLANLADAPTLAALVTASRQPGGPPFVQVQTLVLALGASAARGLLEALAAEQDRGRRLRLIELAASLGAAIVPETRRLLADPRWYVVRNMVLLLRRVQDRSAMSEILRCADHPDLRVRLEAIRALFAFDTKVPRDLLARTINHPDPRLAEAAVLLSGQHGITQATDLLVEILLRWDLFGRRRSLRLKALRALADLADPAVLPRLDRFFRERPFPLVALEERRAAYRLLGSYDQAARAPYLARGEKSRDSLIRDICRALVRASASR